VDELFLFLLVFIEDTSEAAEDANLALKSVLGGQLYRKGYPRLFFWEVPRGKLFIEK